jgi:plastocyanin
MKIKSMFVKSFFLLTCFSLVASKAFCGGTVTGTINASMPKFKKDAVVYLKGVKGPFAAPQAHGVVDQKNLVFVPHVLAVPVGTTVDFKNSDKVNHNIFSADVCKKFNLGTYNPGMSKPVLFDKPCVVNLLCNVHSEMSGFVVVLENPYFSVSGADGKFTIGNVPPGTYEVGVWSEKLKLKEKTMVTVADKQTASLALNISK